MQPHFKLKNALLLMALSAVYPLQSHAAAGIAQFAVGDVNVRRGQVETALNRGQQISSGDQVVTGRSGQTQIRFSDGGLVSLAPNSQFNLDKYADENKPEDGFFASLLRGGMRAITGQVGKRNRDNYRISTSTATIGIRGSAFSANYNPDGSLNVAGEQDGIVVCTNAGCVDLIVGEVVRVTGSDQLPIRTSSRSNVPPMAAREDLFLPINPAVVPVVSIPDETTSPSQQPTTQLDMAASFVSDPESSYLYDSYPRFGIGHFIGNQLYMHDDGEDSGGGYGYGGSSSSISTTSGVSNFSSIGNVAEADFIGWGYWAQGTRYGSNTLSNVHYIVGRPTASEDMPPSTGQATYSLIGGTLPTASYGGTTITGRLLSATLNVDFRSGGRVDAMINTDFIKNGVTVAVPIHEANIYRSGSIFSGNTVSGFLTGVGAAHAGIIYKLNTDSDLGVVSGAAGLSRGPITSSPNVGQ